VLLAGDGGLRRGEIIALEPADVDLRGGRMIVRRNVFIEHGKEYVDTVKGVRAKAIPFTPRLLDALRAVRRLRGPRVLYTDDGDTLTPKVLAKWVMRAEPQGASPRDGSQARATP
jgi:integrase